METAIEVMTWAIIVAQVSACAFLMYQTAMHLRSEHELNEKYGYAIHGEAEVRADVQGACIGYILNIAEYFDHEGDAWARVMVIRGEFPHAKLVLIKRRIILPHKILLRVNNDKSN